MMADLRAQHKAGFSMLFIVFAATTLCAALITRAAISWAQKRDLFDRPNHRSSHTQPTPRGGGVAIVVAFYAALAVAWAGGWVQTSSIAVLLCGVPVAIIGYIDDLRSVSIRSRILVQALSAGAAVALMTPLPQLGIASVLVPTWLTILLYVLALVWLTNLYNFMDGIDAMAAGQAVVLGLAWAAFLPSSHALPALIFGASALGFLAYNWPPARIFMGDVGSGFCGFIAGALALLFASQTNSSPLVWMIPLTIFAADATVTLVVRTLRGRRPGVAHRSHAYQHLARRAGQHLPVSLAYMALTSLVAGLGLTWALHHPESAPATLAACAIPLAIAVLLLRGGHDD